MDKAVYGAHGGIAAAGWPRAFFYLIQFTWGLPVNLVGLLVFLCCHTRFPNKWFRNSIVTYLPAPLLRTVSLRSQAAFFTLLLLTRVILVERQLNLLHQRLRISSR